MSHSIYYHIVLTTFIKHFTLNQLSSNVSNCLSESNKTLAQAITNMAI